MKNVKISDARFGINQSRFLINNSMQRILQNDSDSDVLRQKPIVQVEEMIARAVAGGKIVKYFDDFSELWGYNPVVCQYDTVFRFARAAR